jgi:CheY-like chemotaxis protein
VLALSPSLLLLPLQNLINQKMMLMLLRKLGYPEVLLASNGQVCLEQLERVAASEELHVDLILMDASMDVMDGKTAKAVAMWCAEHACMTAPFTVGCSP